MGLGDMMGKAASALGGGDFDIASKLGDVGIDASMLEGMDMESAKSFIADKGFDLSMVEGLGLNIDDILAKFMGGSE